jgi:choline/glycine/proline betaine transport protein
VDFVYDIRLTEHPMPSFAYSELKPDNNDAEKYYKADVFLRRGGLSYDVYGYTEDDIVKDILDQFENYLHFLGNSPGELPWDMAEHDDMLNTDKA